MKRREAFQRIILAGGTVLFLPAAILSCSENGDGGPIDSTNGLTVDMSNPNYATLLNAGGFIILSGVIIANTDGNTWVALSSTCTHNGCTIGYNATQNNFPCPCHGSVFNANGSVANGPATQPLKQYTVTREGSILTIK